MVFSYTVGNGVLIYDKEWCLEFSHTAGNGVLIYYM